MLLVVLVLALDLAVEEAGFLRGQIVKAANFLLRVVVDMVLDQVGGGHRIDLERLVAVEGEKAQCEQVQQLSTAVRPKVQVFRDEEKEHEVVFVV